MTHLKCYACNLKSHFITNCPRLHYKPDQSFLIKKHLFYSPSIDRIIYLKRKKSKSYNARLKLVDISKAISRFHVKEENEINKNIVTVEKSQEEELEESESALIKACSSFNYLIDISTPKLNICGKESGKENLIEKKETLGFKEMRSQVKEEESEMLSGQISGKLREAENGKEGFLIKRRTSRQGFAFPEGIGSKMNINLGEKMNSEITIGTSNEAANKVETKNFIKILNREENLLV